LARGAGGRSCPKRARVVGPAREFWLRTGPSEAMTASEEG